MFDKIKEIVLLGIIITIILSWTINDAKSRETNINIERGDIYLKRSIEANSSFLMSGYSQQAIAYYLRSIAESLEYKNR